MADSGRNISVRPSIDGQIAGILERQNVLRGDIWLNATHRIIDGFSTINRH